MNGALDIRAPSAWSAIALMRRLSTNAVVKKADDGFHVLVPITLTTPLDVPDVVEIWARENGLEPNDVVGLTNA